MTVFAATGSVRKMNAIGKFYSETIAFSAPNKWKDSQLRTYAITKFHERGFEVNYIDVVLPQDGPL